MPVSRRPRTALKAALTLAGIFGSLSLLSPPGSLQAQAVKYTSVSRGEFGGMLGTLVQMAPGAQEETRETVFIKGSLMRSDQGETSTIHDMATGRYTLINHEDRTWFTMDMAEMMEQFQEMGTGGEWEEEAEEDENPEDEMPEVEVRVTTERTGRTQTFDGYAAEQVYMIMEVIPVTEEARGSAEATGNMVVFTELWLSEDFPGMEAMEEARAEFARGAGNQEAGGYDAALQQAFSQDPRLQEAMEKNMEEMAELQGMPVRTVTSMVMVPLGQEFDAEAVVAASDEPLSSGGMGDLMGKAAGAAASGAAREAMGRFGGILGRNKKEEEERPAEVAPTQSIFMRITSVLEDVRTSGISDSVFEPPADYTQEEAPTWRGGNGQP